MVAEAPAPPRGGKAHPGSGQTAGRFEDGMSDIGDGPRFAPPLLIAPIGGTAVAAEALGPDHAAPPPGLGLDHPDASWPDDDVVDIGRRAGQLAVVEHSPPLAAERR